MKKAPSELSVDDYPPYPQIISLLPPEAHQSTLVPTNLFKIVWTLHTDSQWEEVHLINTKLNELQSILS